QQNSPASKNLQLSQIPSPPLTSTTVSSVYSNSSGLNSPYPLNSLSPMMNFSPQLIQQGQDIDTSFRVTVIGDIHGQVFDLCELIGKVGLPEEQKNHFVFMGDYVDRGAFGCEVMAIVLSLKIAHPESVYLIRGNHEATELNSIFGF
ncbi:MAG: putative Ser/Thr protein phosphatase family protein, partial [Streblomastix strix]